MRRPDKPCVKDHSKITGCFDPADWLPGKLNWLGFGDAPTGLSKAHRGALRDINGDPPFS